MSEKQDLKLGEIISPDRVVDRDAIHIAVMPCVALVQLSPGEHVGLSTNGKASDRIKPYVGVVDPFLFESARENPTDKWCVDPGERFWLYLYPNTITGLRHHWEHPSIDALDSTDAPGSNSEVVAWSLRYIETEANKMGMGANELLEHAREWAGGAEWVHIGYDTPSDEGVDWHKFWQHFEVVTGIKPPKDKRESIQYSCSC